VNDSLFGQTLPILPTKFPQWTCLGLCFRLRPRLTLVSCSERRRPFGAFLASSTAEEMQHFVQMNSMLNATQIVTNELRPIDIRTDLRPAPETILVVEDEAFVREATCDILESEGYRVLRARNATEAQTAFRQNHGSVQLLLSDVVLPGQNGPALAKDLQEAHQALPAIFISGWPGVFTLATLLLVASSAPCSAPRAPVAIASTP